MGSVAKSATGNKFELTGGVIPAPPLQSTKKITNTKTKPINKFSFHVNTSPYF